MTRIAVWNTAFLGDAVLTLPLLQSLRLRYPKAVLDFYVRGGGLAALFVRNSIISSVYTYDKQGKEKGFAGLIRLGRELSKRKYDVWISAHGSLRSSLLAMASRAPVRIGYRQSALAGLCHTHVVDRQFGRLDEIERLLQLLRPLGPGPESHWPEIVLGRQEIREAESFFAELGGPVLGLHPGSVWATKRWPASYFAEIGRRALRTGADVLLFAGPGEEDIALSVYEHISAKSGRNEKSRLHNLSGRLSLPLFAAYISRLSCYVTNDSGPMHLAWSQHVPVTALFGPTVRSLGFSPRGLTSSVCETPIACRPCGLHGPISCPLKHHHCMTRISPDHVWEEVREKLLL
ncbi:MAG: glycosyltransferase family 9 protein [Desulfovibrio sp.]|jgi:heptosyltransferase-2|nr:glycosyltransferase family 9 protein [Desulfovibrio sp.]